MSRKTYDIGNLRETLRDSFPGVVPCHTATEHWYKREDTGRVAASVTTKQGIINKPYLKPWYIKQTVDYIRENVERLREGDLEVLEEAKGAAGKRVNQASVWGTTAHDAIDRYVTTWISDKAPEESCVSFLQPRDEAMGTNDPEEIAACRSFDLFISEVEIVPIASELKCWYEKGKDCFAGTIDCVGIVRTPYKDRVGDKACAHDYEAQVGGTLWCVSCNREVTQALCLLDWKSSRQISGKSEYAQQTVAYAKSIEVAAKIRFDMVWVVRFDKYSAKYEILKVADPKAVWKEFLAVSRTFDLLKSRPDDSLLVPLKERVITYI